MHRVQFRSLKQPDEIQKKKTQDRQKLNGHMRNNVVLHIKDTSNVYETVLLCVVYTGPGQTDKRANSKITQQKKEKKNEYWMKAQNMENKTIG